MAARFEEICKYQQQAAEGDNDLARVASLKSLGLHIDYLRERGHLTEEVPADLVQERVTVFTSELISPHKFKPVEIELLNTSQLVERAHEEAKAYLDFDIPIPKPSELFIETMKKAEGEGIGIFHPFHFFSITLSQDANYPGFVRRPSDWLYAQIEAGKISKYALEINDFWGLFDTSRRPDYDNGKQLFMDDPLDAIIKEGRKSGQIKVPPHLRHVPIDSRFGVSIKEQDRVVFPELGRKLKLTEHMASGIAVIQRPTLAEIIHAGNIRYPHLGGPDTWESFEDKIGDGRRLVGGYRGLANIVSRHYDDHDDRVAFRPLVIPSMSMQARPFFPK